MNPTQLRVNDMQSFVSKILTSALLVVVTTVAACSKREVTGPSALPAQLSFVLMAVGSNAIATVSVVVTGPGIDSTLGFNLTLVNGTAAGTLQVPAGSGRHVVASAFDAAGVNTNRGDTTVTLLAGSNPTVSLTMPSLIGGLPITLSFGSSVVSINRQDTTMMQGDTLRFSAAAVNSRGGTVPGDSIVWASSNPAVASVDSSGLVRGLAIGTANIVANYEGASARRQVTVASPSPYPNEPLGLTRFAEVDFSALPGPAGSQGTLAGNFWTEQSVPYHLTIVSDPTAPQSPSSVLSVDFEAGTQPGYPVAVDTGYRDFGGWAGPNAFSNIEYSEYYESTRFKIPTPDFETQEIGAKMLGYWGVSQNNQSPDSGIGPTELYSMMRGNQYSTSIMTSWNLDMGTQGVTSQYLLQNQNLWKQITAGVWHQFECYMKLNDIGSSNGVWKWWLDGVLIGDYENMQFISAAYPSGFFGRKMNLIWGGRGGTPKTRTDNVWFDHMYMSGRFLRNPAP